MLRSNIGELSENQNDFEIIDTCKGLFQETIDSGKSIVLKSTQRRTALRMRHCKASVRGTEN
jgi:hypothetical protein